MTKKDLEEAKIDLRAEMRDMKTELRGEMKTMEARLHSHIDQATHDAAKHFANVVIEEVQRLIAPLDDKIEGVRDELRAHVHAPGLHNKPRRR